MDDMLSMGHLTFAFAAAEELAWCLCTSKGWLDAASHPALWRELVKFDFGLDADTTTAAASGVGSERGASGDSDAIVGPDGLPCDSPQAAYRSWRLFRSRLGLNFRSRRADLEQTPANMGSYSPNTFKIPLAEARLRMLRAWKSLDAFYMRELPGVAASLRASVEPADWQELQNGLLSLIQQAQREHDGAGDESDASELLPSLAPGLALLRVLLESHDGQSEALLESGRPRSRLDAARWHGAVGGYSAYDHCVSTGLLSAGDVLAWAQRLYGPLQLGRDPRFGRYLCPVAINRFELDKLFFLDLRSGNVHCLCQGSFLRAHPLPPPQPSERANASDSSSSNSSTAIAATSTISKSNSSTSRGNGLGLVHWLEGLARCVDDGTYVAAPLRPGDNETRGLCLFPQRNPAPFGRAAATVAPDDGGDDDDDAASRLPAGAQGRRGGGAVHTLCVSRGVEASASVIFMPEGSQWTYSIKLRLIPPGEPGHVPAAQRGFETCQLQTRHWAIEPGGSSNNRTTRSDQRVNSSSSSSSNSNSSSSNSAASPVLEHVRGDGVVGAFPVLREGAHRADQQVEPQFRAARLREGGWADGSFVYQSCSGQNLPGGSFGGELTFVPGTLKNPTGKPFEVVVAPFALDIPDTIF